MQFCQLFNMKAHEINDFDSILDDAESEAITDWEIEFCADIRDKYDQYEDDMFISNKQLEILERISKR